MDAKEIKSALKEAREDIKNKDFKNALKICKNVLKADRNNYVGLVLFGVSLQETDQRGQAPNAFRKAIDVSPNQILAWQGLASFYEKENDVKDKKELLTVYANLLKLENDIGKFTDTCSKLARLSTDLNEIEPCIDILKKQESSSNNEQQQIIKKTIISVLGSCKDLNPKLSEIFLTALEKSIDSGIIEITEEYFKKYLKLLYKCKKWHTLIEKAKEMHVLYPKLEYPLEWICRAYSEQITLSVEDIDLLDIDIDEYCNKLSQLNRNSSMILLAKGAKLYRGGSYIEACDVLKQVVGVMANSPYLWGLLCQCYARIHCHLDTQHCATEALKILEKQDTQENRYKLMLSILLVRALCHQTEEKIETAITKCKELLALEQGNLDVVCCLARAYISTNNLDAAQKCIAVLEEQAHYNGHAMLLNALLLKQQKSPFRAIEVLNSAVSLYPDMADLWLELGKLYWQENKRELSLVAFLKATKLDPNCYLCFLYLGHYYAHGDKDLDKARRCYQKAFHLNSRSEEAGTCLSDIYRIQKNVELNVQLLTYVTQQVGPGGAKWAWQRLGLLYLEEGNFGEAIENLRAAVRGDPTDSFCWESLADAYYTKGSYIAALKSYERALELSPEALYPMYQVAAIKQLTSQFEEALSAYKDIVTTNPKYVPALKGFGETLLSLAKTYLERNLLGRCQSTCQEAINIFTVAAVEHRTLSCLWKLMGDVCTLMANLPEHIAHLSVQQWLLVSTPKSEENYDDATELLKKDQVLQLGARCYCRSLSILPKSSLIWHDLAVNYHCQANNAVTPHIKKQLREWALMASKQSVTLNSKIWQHWNLLGVVAASNEIYNLRLAQHAFIKSVQAEPKTNPVAWTNLGALYLALGEIKLANEAFRVGQRTDPQYIQCWIGQAMIAESLDHEDTMDLFRHTTSLGVHPESCLGYAEWVCSTLLNSTNKNDPQYKYSIEDMHAVPVAGDCITWYTASKTTDPCAFNMAGLLFERQKLYSAAADSFTRALNTFEEKGDKNTELHDKVRCNYGRVLLELKQYDEAIHQYCTVKDATFASSCGLAVAYYKAGNYQEAYSTYKTILHWLASDDGLKSHVLVAMAAVTYKCQGPGDSKTLLFQSSQLKPPSVQGLFAVCSLGIIHAELNLSESVLKELVPYQHNSDYVTHIAVFKAYIQYLQKRTKEAVRSLGSTTHIHPGQASLWLSLAELLLNLCMSNASSHPSAALAATRCAQIAMTLGRGVMDVSKVMSLVSLGHLCSGNALASLRSSQKAVHMFPDIPENWVVLVASFLPWCISQKSLPNTLWLKRIIGHIRRKMDATRQMGKWLSRCENKVTLLVEEYSPKG